MFDNLSRPRGCSNQSAFSVLISVRKILFDSTFSKVYDRIILENIEIPSEKKQLRNKPKKKIIK